MKTVNLGEGVVLATIESGDKKQSYGYGDKGSITLINGQRFSGKCPDLALGSSFAFLVFEGSDGNTVRMFLDDCQEETF